MPRNEKTTLLGRLIAGVLVAASILFLEGAPPGAVVGRESPDRFQAERFHAGELLVAAPGMRDPRFRRAVILLVEHSAKGAFGLVLNRPMGSVDISRMLPKKKAGELRKEVEIDLHYGGPVRSRTGYVLYEDKKHFPNSIRVGKNIAVSSDASILNAIARGEGPKKIMIALGYSGWGPGQLETELRRGDWFTAPASDDILFGKSEKTKWERAMARRFRTL